MIKLVLGIAMISFVGFAQKPPAAASATQPLEFDAASVKLNTSSTGGLSMGANKGTLIAKNVPVRMLILKGFHAKDFQVTGGPGWLGTERYDVIAKTANTSISDDNLWLLLQPLLEDRFKLRFHKETKQLPVYSLVVAKGGPKMTPHVGDDEPRTSGHTSADKNNLTAKKMSMAKLADLLGEHTDRIVVDNTRLQGYYDFKLDWAQDHSGEPASPSMLGSLQESLGLSGPSLFTALQEQLGLKLESAKGPVQVFVIDSAEKAKEN